MLLHFLHFHHPWRSYAAGAGRYTWMNECHERTRLQDVIGRVESGTDTEESEVTAQERRFIVIGRNQFLVNK